MSASLPEAFLWAASAGVYAAAIVAVLWRMVPISCRPQPLACVAVVALFAATRFFPDVAILPPVLFIAVFVAVVTTFKTLRPGHRNDGLFAILYLEAIAPIFIVVLADYFQAAQTFRIVAAWACAAPAPSTLLYFIVTRRRSLSSR